MKNDELKISENRKVEFKIHLAGVIREEYVGFYKASIAPIPFLCGICNLIPSKLSPFKA